MIIISKLREDGNIGNEYGALEENNIKDIDIFIQNPKIKQISYKCDKSQIKFKKHSCT